MSNPLRRWCLWAVTIVFSAVLVTSSQIPVFAAWAKSHKITAWELKTGYGWQYTNNSRPHNYQMAWLLPSVVIPITDEIGSGFFRGKFTYNPELLIGSFVGHPWTRPIWGIVPLQFRYEFGPHGDWTPYVVGGAGVLYTNVDRKETDSHVNFNPSVGLGARYALNDKLGLTAEYRHIHISSAGIGDQNAGLNAHTFLVGVSVSQ